MIVVYAYFLAGLLFGVAFVTRLAGKLDDNALHGTLGFRLMILPGSILLWPFLAWMVWRRHR